MGKRKKIIVFGAGEYGKKALLYYGEKEVYAFVDNDKSKTNSFYCGKKVYYYPDNLELIKNYSIVIAMNNESSVIKQLESDGIDNYELFSPRYMGHFDNMIKSLKDEDEVILFGIDRFTKTIYTKIIHETNLRIGIAYKGNNKESISGIDDSFIKSIQDYQLNNKIIVISAENDHPALEIMARRITKGNNKVINPFMPDGYGNSSQIVFNTYDQRKLSDNEDFWNESMENNLEMRLVNSFVEELMVETPLFNHVEIETVNRCNGVCSFCPVSVGHDVREKCEMSSELFYKIIDQLSELHYDGRIATFSNNEPFLDPRIAEFNKYIREKLPLAKIHLFTNGTLLTVERFQEIIPYLDELIIDNYSKDYELIPTSKKIKEICEKHDKYAKKVTIIIRNPDEVLTTRGGDAPNRTQFVSYDKYKCAMPFRQMIIRPSGKVSLCCNDPYGKMTLGDLNSEGIMDVWYGEKFQNIRKKLNEGRGKLEHCRFCDTFSVY